MRVDKPVALATPPEPPPGPKPPPTEEEKKRQAARKANWISAGIFFAATGAGAGVSYLLNAFAPRTVGKAVEPVLNTSVGVGQSAGGRFQEQYLNPIRSWVFRAATGPGDKGDSGKNPQQSKVIYPAILTSMIEVSNQRNKLNGRVSGQSDGYAFYRALLQVSCEAAGQRIAEGDLRGGARHVAGALYHDHRIWMEMSPKSQHTFDRMYLQMYPHFHALPKDQVETFRKMVRDEAERLSGGKREGLGEYVEAIVKGITTPDPQPKFHHPLLLQAPGEKPTVSIEAVRQLSETAANDETTETELRAAIDAHFKQLLEGKNWFQRFKIRRTQRRVTRAVLKVVDAKMKELGRTLSMEELWTVVQGQLNADASKRIENKITAISFGAFAGVGAASGVGKFYLERAVSPQIMIGLEAVVFTLVGIAMGTAGSYFQDRFNNIARAFGYGGMEKLTLGGHVERELLDNLLRTWTVDGRIFGGRNAYQWYSRFLHGVVIDSEDAIKAGELEVAATYLANASEYGRTMFFSFSPLMEVFELFFDKVGPHFDCLTEVQRDELLRMAFDILNQRGATPKEMAIYHKPFIEGLLLTNVEPKKA